MVVGAKSCGKTSFVDFLRTALAAPNKESQTHASPQPSGPAGDASGSFTPHYLETELDGERIGLTLYDSKALERHLVDLQLRETATFVEHKFQETFNEEQKVMRATGARDTHVHCVFLLLDPNRLESNIASSRDVVTTRTKTTHAVRPRVIGPLDEELDVDILRTLQGKTTVIPIISKADTITTAHMAHLKRSVWKALKEIGLDPLHALKLDSDGEESQDEAGNGADATADADAGTASVLRDSSSDYHSVEDGILPEANDKTRSASGAACPAPSALARLDVHQVKATIGLDVPDLPMSIISPDVYDPDCVGRRFPWGFADPYEAEHCDFMHLKETVFGEWRAELKAASREMWYEAWRTSRLKTRSAASPVGKRGALPPPINGRAVSGSAAYGSIASKTSARGTATPEDRKLSSSEIGIAIGHHEP